MVMVRTRPRYDSLTDDMLKAPTGALYIVCDHEAALATQLDVAALRQLTVRPQSWLKDNPEWIRDQRVRGRPVPTAVVVDPWCLLTDHQHKIVEDLTEQARAGRYSASDPITGTITAPVATPENTVVADRIDINTSGRVGLGPAVNTTEVITLANGEKIEFNPPGTFQAVALKDADKEVFRFSADGKLFADWAALRAMKDRFDAGERDWPVCWAAAIWTARNSM